MLASLLVFRGHLDWLLFDTESRSVTKFDKIETLQPIDLSISRDGRTVVFTAQAEASRPQLFISANGLSGPAKLLSPEQGFFAAPKLTPDSSSVVFVHNPGIGSGPIGRHETNMNSQLWRIRVDGSALAQLTTSSGCKGAPQPLSDTQILLAHSSCNGEQVLEYFGPPVNGKKFVKVDGLLGQPALSPNRVRLAYTIIRFRQIELRLAKDTVPREQDPVIASAPEGATHFDAQWSDDSKFLFFVAGGELKELEIKTMKQRGVQGAKQ